ncbi:MAG: NlpC/P60 family protein [Smithellaceae bacterium]
MMKRQILILSLLFLLGLSLSFVSGASAIQYEVEKGDNLYTISKKTGVSVQAIKQANGLKGKNLKLKQVLTIPEKGTAVSTVRAKVKPVVKAKPAAHYTVKKGDTLALIAKKTGTPVKQIIAINKIRPRNLRVGQKLALAKAPSTLEKETVTDEERALNDEEGDGEDIASTGDIADPKKENQNNAELLGKWVSPDERKLFVKVATGFLGAPYRLGGSTVRGIDCSAFVRKMYQLFDIALPRTAHEQSNVGQSVDKNELLEGDLVFFRTRKSVGHVGIYVGNNEFVHASSRDKVVRIDNLDSPYFHKRFIRAVRVKGLDENGV